MNIDFYKKLIEESSVGYAYHKILCNEEGIPCDYEFIEVNSAFERYTGLKGEQIIGKKISEIICNIEKDAFDWVKTYGEIAIHGGAKREFEQYSGSLNKWYRIRAWSPEKYYFITLFLDITKEIIELNEHKMLLTAFKDAVFELDETYRFENVIVSDDNILFIPISKNKIIGRNIKEFLSEDMTQLFINAFEKAGSSSKKEVIIFQSPLQTDKRWLKADIKQLSIDDRKKFIVNISDITEQKQYEEELKNKTMELENFFSVNLDLLCIADTNAYFIKVNKSWESILGYSKDYLEGKKFLDFVHPEDVEPTLKVISRLEKQEQVLNFVNRYKCYDGTYKYIEWRSQPYGNLIYAAARDITERKLLEDTIYIERDKFQTTLLSIGDGVISVNKNQEVVLLNEIAEKLTGWSQAEASGKQFEEVFNIINELTREKAENPISKVLETGNIVELANHTVLIKKDCTEIAIEDSAASIKDKHGEIQGVVLVFRDVTEKKKIRNQIEYLSFHDHLTGLYNRRFFEEELLRLDTDRNLPLSIMMFDVNGLKLTNDAFGHEMGDALLKKVAEIIKNECRADDIVARMGGDEFAVILSKADSIQADMIRNRIVDAVAKETLGSIIISVAVGNDTKYSSNQHINEIVKASEDFMYSDKLKTGRTMRKQTLLLIIDNLGNKYEKEQAHIETVRKLCKHMGLALNMTQVEVKALEMAGYLHDIGKIIVPDEVLNKLGKLNEEEFRLTRRHSEAGYQIVKSVEEYSPLAEAVLCHHERWDGNGYPRKLKGEKIPLTARIIAVADAYEAMTAGRSYKKAVDKNEAILELKKNAGTQFDPEIVKVFVEEVLLQNF